MSLRTFLYATEALMAEEGVRFHVETEAGRPEPAPAAIREQNAQSMAMLQGMLGGVQKKKAGRR